MSDKNTYRIGTSGWNYPHWKKRFYPEAIKKKDWFGYYCRHFDTVEVNNTFYRRPVKEVLEKVARQRSCKFCIHAESTAHDHPHEKITPLWELRPAIL
ncbi:MAG: DUF72 domain-containing protein [Candidatus Marinimicrobia bacterium]|nr:DUF72 domain-containing protein [Candidatus Neomarinimicrobiota bacterium]